MNQQEENKMSIEPVVPGNKSGAVVTHAFYQSLSAGDALQKIERLGKIMWESGLFGLSKPAQGAMLALKSITEQRDPLDIMREFHIVEGKFSKKSEAMLAQFQALGGKRTWRWTSWSEDKAAAIVVDKNGFEYAVEFTYDQAERAGIIYNKEGKVKDVWRKSRADMLPARCISKTIRMIEPAIANGMYAPEELDDFTSEEVSGVDVFGTTPTNPQHMQMQEPDPAPQYERADVGDDVEDAEAVVAGPSDEEIHTELYKKMLHEYSGLTRQLLKFCMDGRRAWLQDGEGLEHLSIQSLENLLGPSMDTVKARLAQITII